MWTKYCAELGKLIRYANDFVVIGSCKSQAREASPGVGVSMKRMGLEPHSQKTRMVNISREQEAFEFLGWDGVKETEYPAQSAPTFRPALAVAEGDEAGAPTHP